MVTVSIDTVMPPAKTQAEIIAETVQHFTMITDMFIASKINEYNAANGTAFASADSFTKYAVLPTSTYNAIALRFITYIDALWATARALQAQHLAAGTVPTDAEFDTALNSVVF